MNLIPFFFATLGAAFASPACITVEGPRISGSDLRRAGAAFATIPPDADLGYAPLAGAKRNFRAGELRRLARRYGIEQRNFDEFCVELRSRILDPGEVEERLHSALRRMVADEGGGSQEAGVSGAVGSAARKMNQAGPVLELLDYRRTPVPPGDLEFSASGLGQPSGEALAAGVLWRGVVRYAERHTVPVWAKVRIRYRREVVVAARNLKAGQQIGVGDLRIASRLLSPIEPSRQLEIAEIAGRTLRRSLRAGTVVNEEHLCPTIQIRRGDTVEVVARAGATQLRFDAIATGNAADGQFLTLRNPTSGKLFLAVATGRSSAEVTPAVRGRSKTP